jgi:hypothetical protein
MYQVRAGKTGGERTDTTNGRTRFYERTDMIS